MNEERIETQTPVRLTTIFSVLLIFPSFLTGCGLMINDPSLTSSSNVSSSLSLSYTGSTGKSGLIQSAMSVTPTTISTTASSITSCKIKSGSTNASSFPSTLSINSSTCKITGTPTASLAATEFTVAATDSAGATATATLTLTVSNCDVTATPFGYGAGTSLNPYLICSSDQLTQIRNYLSSYFKLVTNLDLASVSMTPLSATATPFTGTFDGDNNTISNWTHNGGATSDMGLFGLINSSAVVKNINLSNVTISTTGSRLGGLVGQMAGSSSVTNVIVSGSVTGGTTSASVGIVVGSMVGSSQLTIASSSGTVEGQTGIGGVIGTATVTAAVTMNITSISSSATVSGINGGGVNPVGGAVGTIQASGGGLVHISKSYSTGSVTGNAIQRVAGFLGEGYDTGGGGTVRVSNSYSTATVNNSHASSVGGFAGRLGNAGATAYLTNVYATGALTNGTSILGVMGGGGTSTGSYYNSETTGAASGGGTSTGKTTAEMQDSSTYAGWDFTTTWNLPVSGVNGGFPTLR